MLINKQKMYDGGFINLKSSTTPVSNSKATRAYTNRLEAFLLNLVNTVQAYN